MAERPFFEPARTFANPSKMLLLFGFWNEKGKAKLGQGAKDFEGVDKKVLYDEIAKLSDEEAEELAKEHDQEMVHQQMIKTGYPRPDKYYHLIYESYNKPLESYYFWCLNHFRDLFYPVIDKISDVFAASEQSAFYGAAAQRLSLHEDRVSQYLATIGRMVKEMFQIVREIRIIKERLALYRGSQDKDPKVAEHNEIALKGLFVDMVEGGAKNPGSVFGMASNLQFTALPDLFFGVHPKDHNEISREVDKLKVNDKLKEILKRKFASYMTWKRATQQELQDREMHTIKYLRQHYDAIQLYMTWIKPYLKHIKRLQQPHGKYESSEIVGAFEGSSIEVEVLAKRMPEGNNKVFSCVLQTFVYRTSPTMSFSREGRHQGPLHMGRTTMTWRQYAWTQEEIDRYKALREAETFQMLADVDQSIQDAMSGLGDELRQYIEEAKYSLEEREEMQRKKQEAEMAAKRAKMKQRQSFAQEFGFAEMWQSFETLFIEDKGAKEQKQIEKEREKAKKDNKLYCWLHYRNFKKANRLIQW